MSEYYSSDISVHIDDYGYSLEFKAEDENGNPIPLNHLSGVSGICFKVISGLDYVMWKDNVSGHFIINNPSGGLFEWTVQSGFFNQTGIYEGKCILRFSGGAVISLDDLRISCVGRP